MNNEPVPPPVVTIPRSRLHELAAEADQKRAECPAEEAEYWRGVGDAFRQILREWREGLG